MSRTAFYAHCRDKYELFHATIAARFNALNKKVTTQEAPLEEALAGLLSLIRADKTLCHRTVIGNFDFEISKIFTDLLSSRFLDHIHSGRWHIKDPQVEPEFDATYTAYGIAGITIFPGFATTFLAMNTKPPV